jgi:uncharacterized RDD family membrane protein YckC
MRDQGRMVLSPVRWLWRHLPVFLSLIPLGSSVGFLIFAWRRRSSRLVMVGLLYLIAWVLCIALVNSAHRIGPGQYEHPLAIALGSIGFLILWPLGAIHAFRNRDGHPARRQGADVWTWSGLDVASEPAMAAAAASVPPPALPPSAAWVGTSQAGATPSDQARAVADLRDLDSRRLGARLIDGLLILGAEFLIARIAGGMTWGLTIFVLWASVVYFFLCEATTGQTVGKRAMGLRVVARSGEPASAGAVARRNVLRIFEEPFLALIVLVCSRRRRQRIGDFAGGTTVGREAYSSPPAASPMRLVYPALWAIGGLAFTLVVPLQTQLPAPPTAQFHTYAANRMPYAEQIYLREIQHLCIGHNEQIVAEPHPRLRYIVGAELSFRRDLGYLQTPGTMQTLRRRVMTGQLRLDGEPPWFIRYLVAHPNPIRTFLRQSSPGLQEAVRRGWKPIPSWETSCGTGM